MKKILLLTTLMHLAFGSMAQLVPLSAQYYQNSYLINPSMAGEAGGLRINMAYRLQWSGIKEGPSTQALTAEMGSAQKRSGVGLNIYSDRAGLITQTRAMASYAYHLPFDEHTRLHFGLSMGILRQRLNEAGIKGSANDPAVAQFNQREAYLDGDFGAAVTTRRFRAEIALPYLKELVRSDKTNAFNRTKYFTAVAYQLIGDSQAKGFGVEPKVIVRGTNYAEGLVDAGVNLTFAGNKASVMGLYHSQGSVSLGMGMQYREVLGLQLYYNTGISSLRNYTNGDFEIAVRISL